MRSPITWSWKNSHLSFRAPLFIQTQLLCPAYNAETASAIFRENIFATLPFDCCAICCSVPFIVLCLHNAMRKTDVKNKWKNSSWRKLIMQNKLEVPKRLPCRHLCQAILSTSASNTTQSAHVRISQPARYQSLEPWALKSVLKLGSFCLLKKAGLGEVSGIGQFKKRGLTFLSKGVFMTTKGGLER